MLAHRSTPTLAARATCGPPGLVSSTENPRNGGFTTKAGSDLAKVIWRAGQRGLGAGERGGARGAVQSGVSMGDVGGETNPTTCQPQHRRRNQDVAWSNRERPSSPAGPAGEEAREYLHPPDECRTNMTCETSFKSVLRRKEVSMSWYGQMVQKIAEETGVAQDDVRLVLQRFYVSELLT